MLKKQTLAENLERLLSVNLTKKELVFWLVRIPCIIIAVVWVCHVIYFVFGVKTIRSEDLAE